MACTNVGAQVGTVFESTRAQIDYAVLLSMLMILAVVSLPDIMDDIVHIFVHHFNF
jgi:hypothetical protein